VVLAGWLFCARPASSRAEAELRTVVEDSDPMPVRRFCSSGEAYTTTPASPSDITTVIARLRAAGCVFAEDEARLLISAATTAKELDAMVERRMAGEPLEYILGWTEFCGLRIAVAPGVFVPRRRTEFLVEQAALLRQPGSVVVDMCCGSGAVGVALAAILGRIQLHATDIDPTAVRCARGNVRAVGGRVYEGDLFEPLPPDLRGRVDLLVTNAPYVPTRAIAQMPPEARDHEPQAALDGGDDGLDIQRRVAVEAASWLAPTGHLVVETSERQAPESLAILSRHGLAARVARSDELDATVVIGRKRSDETPNPGGTLPSLGG
jgi:release factor glutamine methyltransferase